ncbi:NAD-binding protein [Ensifer adhaerens]|uniref:NAD-binding protein n=1 Tax=Ensifer adhaerens TaxID=106592 RepID=UPI0009EEBB55
MIGLEVAATAVGRGCSVTVIETAPRLVRADHVRAGIAFHFQSSVGRRINGSERVTSVELESGLEEVPCSSQPRLSIEF